MGTNGAPGREVRMLRERLTRLSEASVWTNNSLGLEAVLQEVLESARALTDARYGVVVLLDDSGNADAFIGSGMTLEQERLLLQMPDGKLIFEHLGRIQKPLRLDDLHSRTRSLGLPDYRIPIPDCATFSLLVSPIRYRGELVASIFLGKKEGGRTFRKGDEEILAMFASQAALVIENARRYRDEQRARAGLETLINTSPVGVVVIDAKTGDLTSLNREARRIMRSLCTPNQSTEDLVGVLNIQRSDGRKMTVTKASIPEFLCERETIHAEEVVFKVPDGRSVSALVNATPICDEDDDLESFVVTMQDLTPLEDVERLRGEFLEMVSHELRTPLAAIKGSTATVLGDVSRRGVAEMIQFFNIIGQQADHMCGLIDDLLDVARIATGTLQINPEPVTVTDLVDEARKAVQTGRQPNNIRIELAPGLPPVTADRRRTVQVLCNLLENAIRHSPEASPIMVTAAEEGACVAVCVADQGRGVSEERLPNLFQRLGSQEEGVAAAGSGWGLSICRGIVESQGGRIWAESDGPGKGLRIAFTCPIAVEPGHAAFVGPVTTADGRPRSAKSKTRILVVDDDPQMLRIVREALSKSGLVPIVTGDPDEVPHLLEHHRPSLVVMDLVLPGVDGVQVMADIVEKMDIPVIFLSAYGHEEAIARALDAGAVDYIVKPFSPTELAARIRVALRERTAHDRNLPQEPRVFGDLNIDYAGRSVTVSGRRVQLTDIEYRLLEDLSINAGRIVPYEDLLQRVWETWEYSEMRQLRTAVKNIRRKLGDDAANPTYVFTERRVGYRMKSAKESGRG